MGFLDAVKKGLNDGTKFTKIKAEILKYQNEIKNKKVSIGNSFLENNEITDEMSKLRDEILELTKKIDDLNESLKKSDEEVVKTDDSNIEE